MRKIKALIEFFRPDAPMFWKNGEAIDQRTFLSSVLALAERLPDAPHVINLCQDRYYFSVAFCAGLVSDKIALMPSSRSERAITDLREEYGDHCVISDRSFDAGASCHIPMEELDLGIASNAEPEMPLISEFQIAAITFTSGSTGKPSPNTKTVGNLWGVAELLARRFDFSADYRGSVVATVPSQHMYGLEMAVVMSLRGNLILHAKQPFFPGDIVAALTELPTPRVLVTAPAHLHALVSSGVPMSELDRIVSATAPLSIQNASAAEDVFDTKLEEIYGCTEAGSMATRRTSVEDKWTTLDGVRLSKADDGYKVSCSHLADSVSLQDSLELTDDQTFRLLGRSSDMLNIGGKRLSLADLTLKLLEVEGVEDAVVVLPVRDGKSAEYGERPTALVVTKLPENAVLHELAKRVDPIFLPRPLRKVISIPRNETGKVTLAAVRDLLSKTNKS